MHVSLEVGFDPGDRVRIIDGTSSGTSRPSNAFGGTNGHPTYRATRKTAWVLIELFGRPFPVPLLPEEIEHA
jgi:hypothetical protein